MNNRYIAILVIIIAIIIGVFFVSYKKDTPVITPAPTEVTPTTTPVTTTATTTATTTSTSTKPVTKPTPTPVVTPKPTPAPTPTPTPAPTTSTVKTYTLADISLHKSQTDCWTAVNEKVYDITAYVPRHPGGIKQIMQVCGKDGTFLFEDQHSGDRKPNTILASYKIGDLAK